MHSHDVIVVGAGYSGIHTAYELERHRSDLEVAVLEASEQLGGRARSIEMSPHRHLDFGAHYFGVKQKRIHALANRLAPGDIYRHPEIYGHDPAARTFLEGTWRVTKKSDSFLQIQGLSKRVSMSEVVAIFASLAHYQALESSINVREPWNTPGAKELDARTAASFIEEQPGPDWIREMWRIGILDIISVRAEDISLLYWLWYNRTNGGFIATADDFTGGPQEFSLLCGMQGLLERHAAQLRGGVRTDSAVKRIAHDASDAVVVELEDGELLRARAVVVAVTPGAAGRIRYEPELSEARRLLHAQQQGHSIRAIAVFDEAFWREDANYRFMGWTAGAYADGVEWALDTTQPGGPPTLSLFVSERLVDDAPDPATRDDRIRQSLIDLLGDPRGAEPNRLEVLDWRTIPTIGGGPNTCFAPGVLSSVGEVFGKPEGATRRLFFTAAEYATSFSGYVEGAMASAEVTAGQVLSTLAGRPFERLPRRLSDLSHRLASPLLERGHRALSAAHRLFDRA